MSSEESDMELVTIHMMNNMEILKKKIGNTTSAFFSKVKLIAIFSYSILSIFIISSFLKNSPWTFGRIVVYVVILIFALVIYFVTIQPYRTNKVSRIYITPEKICIHFFVNSPKEQCKTFLKGQILIQRKYTKLPRGGVVHYITIVDKKTKKLYSLSEDTFLWKRKSLSSILIFLHKHNYYVKNLK